MIVIRFWHARRRLGVSLCSLAFKIVCVSYLIIAVVGSGIMVSINGFSNVHTTSAFFEWTSGLAIGAFLMSFSQEVIVTVDLRPLDPLSSSSVNDDENDVRRPLLL